MRQPVVLVSLNVENNYSLAITYLKLVGEHDARLADAFSFHTLNLNVASSPRSVARQILAHRPVAVGFSCYVWNVVATLEVIRLLKRARPDLLTIVGGQEVTNSQVDYLAVSPHVDVVVDGEGEATFADLMHWLAEGRARPLTSIPGLHVRQDGESVFTGPRQLIPNLDDIPSPYLADEVPVTNSTHLGMMVEVTRGCPYQCGFCFEALKYRRVRSFSMARVESDLAHMAAQGIRKFHILDPILANCHPRRLEELSRVLARVLAGVAGAEISVEIYAELIRAQTARFLAPYHLFDVGLQSVHPPTLANIRRRFDCDRFQAGVGYLRNMRKQVNIYLIAGLPGDNFWTLLTGVAFSTRNRPDLLFINHLCVLNGTALRRDAARHGLRFRPRPPYLALAANTFPRAELDRALVFAEAATKRHNLHFGPTPAPAPTAPLPTGHPGVLDFRELHLTGPDSLPQAKHSLDQPGESYGVMLSGGDTISEGDLLALVRYARFMGHERIGLADSPRLLSQPGFVPSLLEAGALFYQLTHEHTCGRPPDPGQARLLAAAARQVRRYLVLPVREPHQGSRALSQIAERRQWRRAGIRHQDVRRLSPYLSLDITVGAAEVRRLPVLVNHAFRLGADEVTLDICHCAWTQPHLLAELSDTLQDAVDAGRWLFVAGVPLCLLSDLDRVHAAELHRPFRHARRSSGDRPSAPSSCLDCLVREICCLPPVGHALPLQPLPACERLSDLLRAACVIRGLPLTAAYQRYPASRGNGEPLPAKWSEKEPAELA